MKSASMSTSTPSPSGSGREPVRRRHVVRNATPREIYEVVVDFEAYPRLFPDFKATRLLSSSGDVHRVEFRAQAAVLAVRYVLDLTCRPDAPSVDWTFVEGEIVTNSTGSWRFAAQGPDTVIDYTASLDVRAPLPGFVLRKVTDGLVSVSVPAMFASIEREVRRRKDRVTAA
jgi:ribosome-associated toxin RatA of RatAB toxin-antitoxin module